MVLMLMSMVAVAADTRIETRTGTEAEVRTTDVRETGTERELRDDTTTVREETRDRDMRETLREAVRESDTLREPERDARETHAIEERRRQAVEATVRARAEIREDLEARRAESYREARVRYSEANEDYAESRRALIEAEARGDTALEQRKRVALSAIAQLETYLDLLERRVRSSDGYDDAERARVLERLENYRGWLEAGRARVDAATSVEQLSNVIGILRGEWGHVQAFAQTTAHQSIVAQISNLLVEARTASNRVDQRIAVLARAGADVEVLEALKIRYDTRLEAATEHVMTARRAYAAEPSEETRSIIARAAREARAELSEAYLILRQIIAEMRDVSTGLHAETSVRARVIV
ncbi:MAG: hypothetical protein ACMXYM_02550 [Candidatus Woesearchaeota archaeon]